MPSRKRAKGKERKLKQQARQSVSSSSPPPAVGNGISLPEQNIPRVAKIHAECLHGALIPPRGHPVYEFINTFREGCVFEDGNINIAGDMVDAVYETFEKHEDVWKDSTLRTMAINIILRIGTDLIIDRNLFARFNCIAIVFLENYDGEDKLDSAVSKATEDLTYLLCAEEREIVHFYRKRIPCSCLDKLYSEIKKIEDRGSRCFHCKQTVKSKDIKTCSRCKFVQYCSKECQIKDWPTHKGKCVEAADFHKGVKKAETVKKNQKRV